MNCLWTMINFVGFKTFIKSQFDCDASLYFNVDLTILV